MFNAFIDYTFKPFVIIGVIAFFVRSYIDFKRDERIEKIRSETSIRNKAGLIAALISRWINHSKDYIELNQLSFEAFLWLPEDIAKELSKTLSNNKEALNCKDILLKVRHHLIGEDQLRADEIVHFPAHK
jgi:hypothetical protein